MKLGQDFQLARLELGDDATLKHLHVRDAAVHLELAGGLANRLGGQLDPVANDTALVPQQLEDATRPDCPCASCCGSAPIR